MQPFHLIGFTRALIVTRLTGSVSLALLYLDRWRELHTPRMWSGPAAGSLLLLAAALHGSLLSLRRFLGRFLGRCHGDPSEMRPVPPVLTAGPRCRWAARAPREVSLLRPEADRCARSSSRARWVALRVHVSIIDSAAKLNYIVIRRTHATIPLWMFLLFLMSLFHLFN